MNGNTIVKTNFKTNKVITGENKKRPNFVNCVLSGEKLNSFFFILSSISYKANNAIVVYKLYIIHCASLKRNLKQQIIKKNDQFSLLMLFSTKNQNT